MALAAKYQDKFVAAHEAMIGVSSTLTEPRIRELLAGAGIDMDRLNRDLTTNAKAIDAILAATTLRRWRSDSGARRPSSSASSACRAS